MFAFHYTFTTESGAVYLVRMHQTNTYITRTPGAESAELLPVVNEPIHLINERVGRQAYIVLANGRTIRTSMVVAQTRGINIA